GRFDQGRGRDIAVDGPGQDDDAEVNPRSAARATIGGRRGGEGAVTGGAVDQGEDGAVDSGADGDRPGGDPIGTGEVDPVEADDGGRVAGDDGRSPEGAGQDGRDSRVDRVQPRPRTDAGSAGEAG